MPKAETAYAKINLALHVRRRRWTELSEYVNVARQMPASFDKVVLISIAAALLAACTFAEHDSVHSRQQELMAKIEARLELPEGAWSIADYGRNYAIDDDGEVIAIYDLSSGSDGQSAKPGEARWFEDVEELPMIMDGGCGVLTVIYNPETEHLDAFCNGVA